jgi:hypothetical protein
MKIVWLCIWFAFAAAEVGLTLWTRSATFLEIGVVIPVMIAFNLQRVRPRARARIIQPQVVIG